MMLYRTLGSTGLKVSVVGLGTWQYGGEWGAEFTPSDVDAIMGTALDEGINLIDTAECYGDHLSEMLIGERMQRERSRWVLASKFGHAYHGYRERTRHWSGEEMRRQLHDSLRALRTDYLDILQFHSPTDEEFLNEELWNTLATVKREGLVRHIGLSVSKNDNLLQVDRSPDAGSQVLQIVYNRLDRTPERDVLPRARELNLGVFARVPLASGFLSGKYRSNSTFDSRDWRNEIEPERLRRITDEVEEIRRTELPEGASLASWALAWPLNNPAVTAVIPGCKSPRQVRENVAAVAWVAAPESHPQAIL